MLHKSICTGCGVLTSFLAWQECERQKAAADRQAWQRPGFRYKFAVHALLSGDRRAAEILLRASQHLPKPLAHRSKFMHPPKPLQLELVLISYPQAGKQAHAGK